MMPIYRNFYYLHVGENTNLGCVYFFIEKYFRVLVEVSSLAQWLPCPAGLVRRTRNGMERAATGAKRSPEGTDIG